MVHLEMWSCTELEYHDYNDNCVGDRLESQGVGMSLPIMLWESALHEYK